MSYPGGPRNFVTTPDDKSGTAMCVSAVLMTYAVCCYLIRVYTRAEVNGPFGLDDLMVSFGTVHPIPN